MTENNDWVRSTFCSGGSCVEVKYVRSTYCSDGACVEAGQDCDDVLIRDSKNPDQAPLRFTHAEWQAFVDGMRAGETFGIDTDGYVNSGG